MSSSEQAPEPTMDEILASIRKIISDDEPEETAGAEAAPAEHAAAAEPVAETPPAEEPADDILDLTRVVEPQAPEAQPPAAPEGQLQSAIDGLGETPAAEAPAPAPSEGPGELDINSILAEAGVQDTVAEAPAEPAAPAPEPMAAPQPQAAPEDSSLTDALSSLEQSMSDPEPAGDASMSDDGSIVLGEAVNSAPAMEAPPVPEPAAPEPAAEPSIAMPAPSEPEMPEVPGMPEAPAAGVDEPAQDFGAEALEPAQSIDMGASDAAMPEDTQAEGAEALAASISALTADIDETVSAQADETGAREEEVEAASAPAEDGKTLEDSIKEMLRPMLREWLDDNMERIVKDEVSSGKLKDMS